MSADLNRRNWCLHALALSASALMPSLDGWSAFRRPMIVPAGYVTVGLEYGVPSAVLFAVALQESQRLFGRHRLPWPWTLNVRGKPYRFQSHVTATQSLRLLVDRNVSLVDIGLMQVCWHYFRERLRTPELALQPYWNLRVGASILRDHYRATDDWFAAIGRYHAPADPARAQRYAQRVAHLIQGLAHA